jgi:hypothetical protein
MSCLKYAQSARVASLVAALLCGGTALLIANGPAFAQEARPSSNTTINLANLLVKKGLISRADADALIKQASDEAISAQMASSPAAAAYSPRAAAAPITTTAPGDGAMHVTYVPEGVRKKMKEEIKQEVMAEAEAQHWAAPNAMPEWTQRVRLFGDVRTRYEGIFLPSNNDKTGAFPNFNAINTGNPFDTSSVSNPSYPPEYNVDQERNRFRLQMRLGVDADLGEDFLVGVRIGTGDSSNPISLNQTLGSSGGNFSKYALWLDRAYLEYKPRLSEHVGLVADVGRFPNPFLSTDLVFDNDVNFDGAALKTNVAVAPSVNAFVTAGAFPVFNTALDFATYQSAKFASHDKYLFAGQAGVDWTFGRDWAVKLGGAYYDFDNVAGKLSSACVVLTASDACDTDATRPSFAQKGNSYMALRQIVQTADNSYGTTKQYQYYGLASAFRELTVDARIDFSHFEKFHIGLIAEFVKNVAFDRDAVGAMAINNRGSVPSGATVGPFDGGDIGYFVQANFGKLELKNRWDWNVGVGYKYLESDAVIDGLTDSDFGLGGTNLKGYVLRGNLALSSRVYAGLSWFSADSIAGAPFSSDVVQFDIGARF